MAQIQYYRGDKSPESALTYLSNKGELMRQVEAVHGKAIDYLDDLHRGTVDAIR